ncbi:TPA: hypothetical protein MYK22_001009 [Klebsiella pneumoniae]|uniref:hypothetical protein n=1 Tax=Klebsiella pneumoniae TaxID=573 RepID=UPI001C7E3C50|nr:hypothetical protein [Klebsiella pneumoniae]MBX4517575.1 hypothetical protein [Klebsiella pneumoniae]HCA9725809.1 hypothetical protein [Klebsiella pneumoniae]HCF8671117.1 hypothetical protein [Klebsiella pneumoniae]HCT7764668.1 hypothetical protein [Klebsiella pneumoniae]
MSKYRKGAVYLRKMKASDKSNNFRTSMRMALFNDKTMWKRPEEVKPVVLVQHGESRVVAVFMNMDDAMRSMFSPGMQKRCRNARHNPRRGLRHTKGDLAKAFRRRAYKHNKERTA